MFYTKYRPQKFSEISRPNEAADALATQVATAKTVHAYLFVGPRGTGKTSTARILAKALNCKKVAKNGDPCGKCSSCESIKNGNYVDLIEIDAASNRGIDDIRQLKEKVRLAPSVGTHKIYIIDEVHMLTSEAFNALLKTLEEPPKNTIFILCTTEFHKVPDTIKSRCQIFKFKRATAEQIATKLLWIAEEEGHKLSLEDAKKIAMASLGGFRDAENLLQQVLESGTDLMSLTNKTAIESYGKFLAYLVNNDAQNALILVNSLFNEGVDLYVWLGELIKHLREILLSKSGCSHDILENLNVTINMQDKSLDSLDIIWISGVIERFIKAHSEIKSSYIPQLPIELAIIDITYGRGDEDKTGIETKDDSDGSYNNKGQGSTKRGKVTNLDIEKKNQEAPTASKKEHFVSKAPRSPDPSPDAEPLVEDKFEVQMNVITDKWSEVVDKVKGINSSILALLKAGTITKVEGRFLVLQVRYSFHKERIESPRNRTILEKVLNETFGLPLSIKCEVAKLAANSEHGETGVLTDYNVVPAELQSYDRDKVVAMFDGGLPL